MSSPVLSVVTWKWTARAGYRSTFTANTVNVLRRMVARNYPHPHRFICVTDDPDGLDPQVEVVPDWKDFVGLSSPHGGSNPACYRRLRMFSPDIGKVFGKRFVSLDIDCVIARDMTPIWNRPEAFVIWGDTNPQTVYNGSMILMDAGARPQVWNDFDPKKSPELARAAGNFGSDQAWISYRLGPGEAKWSRRDGVYSFRNEIQRIAGRLPEDARIVMFHGAHDPWGPVPQKLGWVKRHWC
jgi:hypothetical protein